MTMDELISELENYIEEDDMLTKYLDWYKQLKKSFEAHQQYKLLDEISKRNIKKTEVVRNVLYGNSDKKK